MSFWASIVGCDIVRRKDLHTHKASISSAGNYASVFSLLLENMLYQAKC